MPGRRVSQGFGGRYRRLPWSAVLLSLFIVSHMLGCEDVSSVAPEEGGHTRPRGPAGEVMQVQFERTGGFAGMRMAATIDSDSLTPEEAQRLRELVDASGFFELPAEISGAPGGNDRFLYSVTVHIAGRSHTVRTGEAAIPAGLRPLIDLLSKAARDAQRSGGKQ